MSVMDATEQLARVVLLAANRTQAKGSTVRPIVPLAPEVAQELDMELDDDVIVAAEEYLLKRGYVAPANIGLSWGTYTITPAGFSWLEESSSESSPADRLRALAEKPGEVEAFVSALRAELEEQHQLVEIERELGEEPPGGPQSAGLGSNREETPPAGERAREDAKQVSWWRRVFGG